MSSHKRIAAARPRRTLACRAALALSAAAPLSAFATDEATPAPATQELAPTVVRASTCLLYTSDAADEHRDV